MADFSKLYRYRAILKKMKERRIEIDEKIKLWEHKCEEEEKTMVHDIVHEANMTPEQLMTLIGMNARQKLDAINSSQINEESEEDPDEEI